MQQKQERLSEIQIAFLAFNQIDNISNLDILCRIIA